jgi:hypothetical protein
MPRERGWLLLYDKCKRSATCPTGGGILPLFCERSGGNDPTKPLACAQSTLRWLKRKCSSCLAFLHAKSIKNQWVDYIVCVVYTLSNCRTPTVVKQARTASFGGCTYPQCIEQPAHTICSTSEWSSGALKTSFTCQFFPFNIQLSIVLYR